MYKFHFLHSNRNSGNHAALFLAVLLLGVPAVAASARPLHDLPPSPHIAVLDWSDEVKPPPAPAVKAATVDWSDEVKPPPKAIATSIAAESVETRALAP